MKTLVVAERAENDIRNIARYTEQHWGHDQKSRYVDEIRRRMSDILLHPAAGTPREYIRPGLRSIPAGRHIIFYRETPAAIEVIRVLHRNMDVDRRLAE